MHPAIIAKWKRRSCWGPYEGEVFADGRHGDGSGGRRSSRPRGEGGFEASGRFDGLLFGVRRPLRFMAHKLDLNDAQVKALAQVLNELKTERAQADVDYRRTIAQVADLLEADVFDASAAEAALELRVKSAENLRQAVARALAKTHALLEPEQRERLAYLLRSGVLTV